jgi:hypothetical protein
MKILFALIAIFWWVAIWGLSDLATQDWTSEEKFKLYIGLIIFVLVCILAFPDIVDHI